MRRNPPKTCPVCGQEYTWRNKFCSKACYIKSKTHLKTCVVCGKLFADPACNLTITCSPECSKIHRQQMHADGKYLETLDKAHEAFKTNPKTGHFETHMHAKTWKIQAPDGQIYECRNLLLWFEQHADLLDGTPRQAWDGITKIKYSMQGKRKNKSYQWKGWRLLEWAEN
jgi:predicted nucleic acid-binding Zn ribbon protein